MKHSENPLAWWERSGTRRAIAISFLVGVFFGFLAVFPPVSKYYDNHSVFRNVVGCVVAALGLFLALFELKHSGEANEHREEQNRLTREANDLRDKANEYRAEANRLGDKNIELQMRIHGIQENIEKKLTKIRMYARVLADGPKVQLLVSNLSEFDLWINQVELIVTEGARTSPATRIVGGGGRISRGQTEDGYDLYSALISVNGGQADRLAMKFHIKVVVTGVDDDPATIKSPDYDLTLGHSSPPVIKVVKY